ncbi:MAG: hypothetical protein ACR2P0_12400 [Acidimicrobiales bacterium]
MTVHEFLSGEWIDAARGIRAEYADRIPDPEIPMRANVIVRETPFETGQVEGFIDTSDGSIMLELGELEDPELTVTLDYDTARALFVTQDVTKVMEAFMTGRILVTGDVARILGLTPPSDPDQIALVGEIAERLDAITAG